MNTPKQLPDEQALLEHYRAHDDAQPSAELDALILAAARAAVEPPRPSLLARLRDLWRKPQGLALAFGSLASMALVLGLVLKGLPQKPEADDRQVAPVLREELGETASKKLAPSTVMPSPAPLNREMSRMSAAPSIEALADHPGAASGNANPDPDRDAGYAPQSLSKPAVAPLAGELEQSLHEILRLREEGLEEEAQQLLQDVRKKHPQLDLEARLEQLRLVRDAAGR